MRSKRMPCAGKKKSRLPKLRPGRSRGLTGAACRKNRGCASADVQGVLAKVIVDAVRYTLKAARCVGGGAASVRYAARYAFTLSGAGGRTNPACQTMAPSVGLDWPIVRCRMG